MLMVESFLFQEHVAGGNDRIFKIKQLNAGTPYWIRLKGVMRLVFGDTDYESPIGETLAETSKQKKI